MPLTDVAARNAKPAERLQKLFHGQVLYLLVQPRGAKRWRLKYRFAGKEKLLSLGSYSEVALKEARLRRDKAREQLRDGLDPCQLRKEAKATPLVAAVRSYEAVALAWNRRCSCGKNPKHAAGVLSRLFRRWPSRARSRTAVVDALPPHACTALNVAHGERPHFIHRAAALFGMRNESASWRRHLGRGPCLRCLGLCLTRRLTQS